MKSRARAATSEHDGVLLSFVLQLPQLIVRTGKKLYDKIASSRCRFMMFSLGFSNWRGSARQDADERASAEMLRRQNCHGHFCRFR